MNVLKSFLPWILYYAFIGVTQTSHELAAGLAIFASVFYGHEGLRKGFIIDWLSIIYFVFLEVNVLFLRLLWVHQNAILLSNIVLALIPWLSLLMHKPFTMQYAQQEVPESQWNDPTFININYILTYVWAIALTIIIFPPLLLKFAHISHAIYYSWVLQITIVIMAIIFTEKYPDYYILKRILQRFDFNLDEYSADNDNNATKPLLNPVEVEALQNGDSKQEAELKTPVLIVGAGPVGLTTAILLARHGIESHVVEKHPGTSIHPKARAVSTRSMEIFRSFGIEAAIRKHEIGPNANAKAWKTSLISPALCRIATSTKEKQQSPTGNCIVSQDILEQELLKHAQSYPQIKLSFSTKCCAISQDEDGVKAQLYDRTKAIAFSMHADYLIGADGAHSAIRQLLNIKMRGQQQIASLCSIYCKVDLTPFFKNQEWAVCFILNKEHPGRYVLSVNGTDRWLFMANCELEQKAKITPDDAIQIVQEVIGIDTLPIEILNLGHWTMGAQIADSYRDQRVFLAGDAAHRIPTAGGIGMNTGLQDAQNIAWKLAYVMQGKMDSKFLDTYMEERNPIAKRNINWSGMNMRSIAENIFFIEKLNVKPQKEALYQQRIKEHITSNQNPIKRSTIDLRFAYESALVVPDNQEEKNRSRRGIRAPHVKLKHNDQTCSIIDLFEHKFILLCAQESQKWHELSQELPPEWPVEVITIGENCEYQEAEPGRFTEAYNIKPNGAVLVRPDGHIAWKAQKFSKREMAELSSFLETIFAI